MYRFEDIRRVHLEVTTRCNAACPQCPRNISGGRTNPDLPLVELTLADVQTIFPGDFIRQLRGMFMCGNYGDPMVAHDTLAIFEHFRRESPKVHLKLNTNASGRDAAWWRALAKTVD